jgi:hypothetical protein
VGREVEAPLPGEWDDLKRVPLFDRVEAQQNLLDRLLAQGDVAEEGGGFWSLGEAVADDVL